MNRNGLATHQNEWKWTQNRSKLTEHVQKRQVRTGTNSEHIENKCTELKKKLAIELSSKHTQIIWNRQKHTEIEWEQIETNKNELKNS